MKTRSIHVLIQIYLSGYLFSDDIFILKRGSLFQKLGYGTKFVWLNINFFSLHEMHMEIEIPSEKKIDLKVEFDFKTF